jgi:poly(3-hydroxybutyrate) depolymerase
MSIRFPLEVTDYLGCPAGKKMSFLKLNGGGHAWPSGLNQPKWLVGNTSQEIDGAAFVWQFVKDVSKEFSSPESKLDSRLLILLNARHSAA